ncbi:porin [Amantichitinum ursilacus]|uniref:Major outer membrane protein P.IA n=1 Tax=Amantichitinum ursilacus TaxID=857265 RepID=A0A0N0XLT7_9NEIS|nr:porin [Amantichitinum ursilacus]KPC53571.1 Major outer membrane protein P.IA precursor [Amantichitinum ursilacus]
MFKRALIAAAVTATFAAPAFADVTISGAAEMDIFVRTHQASSSSNGDGGSSAILNETDLTLNFDGVDKLDSGDKLIWHVAQKVATPGTVAWGSREAYIGLSGNWGTFRSGRVFAPSYLALDAFQWGAGNLWEDYGANAVWFKSALAYTTPDFGGFGVQVAYDLGTKTAQGQTWAVDAIATYNGNGLSLAGGYQQQKGVGVTGAANPAGGNFGAFNQDDAFTSGGDTGLKQEFYFAQGNWDIGNGFTVRGGWKHNKWTDDNHVTNGAYGFSNSAENDQFLVAGAYSWGKNSVALGWQDIVNSKTDGNDNKDHDLNQIFGQYTYGLSKNTVSFLQVRYHKFKDDTARPLVAATWQVDGTATGTNNGARVLVGTWTGF